MLMKNVDEERESANEKNFMHHWIASLTQFKIWLQDFDLLLSSLIFQCMMLFAKHCGLARYCYLPTYVASCTYVAILDCAQMKAHTVIALVPTESLFGTSFTED
jgi:hypothetical protein